MLGAFARKNNLCSCIVNNNQFENNGNISKKVKEDYRKTIFLYAESCATKVKNRKDYVGYLNYECGITNPDIIINS